MPPRMDYAVELGQARCHSITQQKLQTNCDVNAQTGCWLFVGSLNNDDYAQVGPNIDHHLPRHIALLADLPTRFGRSETGT